jgi:CheY-like chemotaxis protein
VNFRAVVKSLERRFKARAVKKNLALIVDIRKMAHWHFKLDEVRFMQCVSSLLAQCLIQTNKGAINLAFDFSGSGKGKKGALVVTIKDDSDGMDQYATETYFRPEVYEINNQMTNSEGRRLSLMLARMLVQKMGGDLSVKSAIGSGVTFQITLPVEMAPAPANEVELSELSPVERARTLLADKTILAVDDNIPNLMIVKALLSQGKVGTILTAENGLEAIKIIAQGKCDLVLMDVQMPVLDGLTATREIRRCGKSFANVPIIALTAAVRAEDTQNYKEGGMNAVLAKPVILEDMFETIERVLFEEENRKAA